MMQALMILLLLQQEPRPQVLETADLHVLVPNGWTVAMSVGGRVRLEHRSGASFEASRNGARGRSFTDSAEGAVERVWRSLGFAAVGKPEERKVRGYPALRYEIAGNRLSLRRRISYTIVDRQQDYYELIYENSESGFDLLAREAEQIASSVQPLAEVNEQRITERLRALNVAQNRFFETYGRYASTQELDGTGWHHGHSISVTVTLDGYRITAIPERRSLGLPLETGPDGTITRIRGQSR